MMNYQEAFEAQQLCGPKSGETAAVAKAEETVARTKDLREEICGHTESNVVLDYMAGNFLPRRAVFTAYMLGICVGMDMEKSETGGIDAR